MDTNYVIATTAAILFGLGLTIAAWYLIGWLKAQKLNGDLTAMIGWITIKVRDLEIQLSNTPGIRKKELAMIFARRISDTYKFGFSDDQLSSIIEACVYGMRQAAKMTPGTRDDEFVEAATKGL